MEFSSAGKSRYQSEFKIESRVWLLVCFCSVGCRTKNIKRSMITYRYSPCTHCVQSTHSPEEPGQDTSGNVFLISHCPLSWQNGSGWECRVPFPVCGVNRWRWDTNQGRNGSVFTPKTCPSACCSDDIQSRTIYQVFFLLLRAKQHFSSLTKPVRKEGTVRQLRPIWRNQRSLCLCLLSPRHPCVGLWSPLNCQSIQRCFGIIQVLTNHVLGDYMVMKQAGNISLTRGTYISVEFYRFYSKLCIETESKCMNIYFKPIGSDLFSSCLAEFSFKLVSV